MSAGNKKVNWSPKDEEVIKVASNGTPEVKEEVNALYEAAKKFAQDFGKKEEVVENCEKCKKGAAECTCAKEECKDVVKKDDETAIIEIETPEGEKAEHEAVGEVEQAVEKLEEVVVELKDAVGKSEVAEEKEIEIEIEEDGDKPKLEFEVGEKSVVPEIPGKDVSQSEIIVESKPDCGCMAKKEVKLEKSAATEEEFCRFAKLSPANRKKLGDYWKNMLGFPKDYVDLMVKDYEK